MKKKMKEDVLNSYVHCLHKAKSKRHETDKYAKIVEDIQRKYVLKTEDIKKCQATLTLKKKYDNIKKAHSNIVNYKPINENKDFVFNPYIFNIYHTIETEKLNAADMYNVMHALKEQVNINLNCERKNERRINHYKRIFDSQGGRDEMEVLKNLLLSLGVNVYE